MFLFKALIIPNNKRFPTPFFLSATANYLYVLKFIMYSKTQLYTNKHTYTSNYNLFIPKSKSYKNYDKSEWIYKTM